MPTQTAVIVGTGSGLGAALARRFAAAGFNLALSARNADRLAPLVKELEGMGVKARAFGVDATDEAGMKGLFADAETLGPVAVAIHNVNGRVVKDVLDLSTAEFESQWRAICLGGFLTGREATRLMAPAVPRAAGAPRAAPRHGAARPGRSSGRPDRVAGRARSR